MIRWTGLAPWEFEFRFPGSLTATFLRQMRGAAEGGGGGGGGAPPAHHGRRTRVSVCERERERETDRQTDRDIYPGVRAVSAVPSRQGIPAVFPSPLPSEEGTP